MKVKIHNEEFPKGIAFDVGGLLFLNGEMTTVSKEEQDEFAAKTGESLADALKRNTLATVDGVGFVPVEPAKVAEPELDHSDPGDEGGVS